MQWSLRYWTITWLCEGRNRCSGGYSSSKNGNSGHGRCGHGYNCNNTNTKAKPNSSGFYPPAEWNKLSFEEHDKIWKEHDKKGEQGGTKQILGDISVEHVTVIIGAMHQAQSVNHTNETELTSNTQAGNFFGGKANIKKTHTIEWLAASPANASSSHIPCFACGPPVYPLSFCSSFSFVFYCFCSYQSCLFSL